MAKEKKRKQPADAPPPGDEGERKGQNDKKPKKEKAAPAQPSQIKNKDKYSEVHAKLKREKKAQKRKLARERDQAAQRAAELGEQPPERQVPRTIENTREADETVCWPDDQEVTRCPDSPCLYSQKDFLNHAMFQISLHIKHKIPVAPTNQILLNLLKKKTRIIRSYKIYRYDAASSLQLLGQSTSCSP